MANVKLSEIVSGSALVPATDVCVAVRSGTTDVLVAMDALNATTVTAANEASDTSCFPVFVTAATGNLGAKTNAGLAFNSNTSILTATGFAGSLTGNVTGNVSGTSGSTTGNAATATALATARAIYGNNFDGTAALTQIIASTYGGTGNGFTKISGPTTSEKTVTIPDANLTITAAAATVLDDTTVGAMVDTLGGASASGTGGLVRITSATLVTPLLGTPTSGTLTNCTNYPVANIANLGTGVATFLATPSSANFASAVTGETGSGALVFGTSPAIGTPTITDGVNTISTAAAGNIGYLGMPQRSVSADTSFALADIGGSVYHPAADTTARTWTIPANASVAFPVATGFTVYNENAAGALTIAITSDTLRWGASTGSRTIAANGTAFFYKATSTVWRVTGDGIT